MNQHVPDGQGPHGQDALNAQATPEQDSQHPNSGTTEGSCSNSNHVSENEPRIVGGTHLSTKG